MALWSTQTPTEMSTRNISWGVMWLTTLPPSCADYLEIWEPQPPGNLWLCPELSWDCFTFKASGSNTSGSNGAEYKDCFLGSDAV